MAVHVHIHRRSRDEASFKETEHPRGPDGKFKTYYAGGSLTPLLGQAGFVKQKGTNKVTYTHPTSGHKVVIEPPKGSSSEKWASSSQFSVYHPSHEPKKGTGGKELSKHIGTGTTQQLEPPSGPGRNYVPEEPASVLAVGADHEVAKALKSKGFELVHKPPSDYGQEVWKKGESAVVTYTPATQTWQSKSTGFYPKQGAGAAGLSALLGGGGPSAFQALGVQNMGSNGPATQAEVASLVQAGAAATEAAKKNPAAHQAYWAGQEKAVKAQVEAAAAKTKADQAAYAEAMAKQQAAVTHATQLLAKLTPHAPVPVGHEKGAVSHYTGSGYGGMNSNLRHEPPAKAMAADPKIKPLTDYLDKASIPEPCTVYRKVSGDYAKVLRSIAVKGTIFQDKGFMSTSANKDKWSGDLRWEIEVPKGAKGAAVKHLSSHPSEDEVLFQRGHLIEVLEANFDAGFMRVRLLHADVSH